MERRTTLIIFGIIFFVIGIPLLFMFELARGFGSSAGDYYRINTVEVNLLEFENKSKDTLILSGINVIDTSAQYACSLKFGIDYYSQAGNTNSGLYAALAPGLKGCKEKIDSIAVFLLDPKTQRKTDLSVFIVALNDTVLNNKESESIGYKRINIMGTDNREAYVFNDLKDLKYRFNVSNGEVFDHLLEQRDVLFFFDKDFSKNFNTGAEAHVFIKLSDGRVLKSVAGKTPRGNIANK